MQEIRLNTPLAAQEISKLRAGDGILLTGTIYTARDRAHQRLIQALDSGQPLPFRLEGACIYYAGPSPAPPGQPIGAIGPTTAYRMDSFTPRLLEAGLSLMIGKGRRSKEVRDAISRHQAAYAAAWGGAGALLASKVKKAACIAYADLGPEAVYALEVCDFPALIINDSQGNDAYDMKGKRHQYE